MEENNTEVKYNSEGRLWYDTDSFFKSSEIQEQIEELSKIAVETKDNNNE